MLPLAPSVRHRAASDISSGAAINGPCEAVAALRGLDVMRDLSGSSGLRRKEMCQPWTLPVSVLSEPQTLAPMPHRSGFSKLLGITVKCLA